MTSSFTERNSVDIVDLTSVGKVKIASCLSGLAHLCLELISESPQTFSFLKCEDKQSQYFKLNHLANNLSFSIKTEKRGVNITSNKIYVLPTDHEAEFLIAQIDNNNCMTVSTNPGSIKSFFNIPCSTADFLDSQRMKLVDWSYVQNDFKLLLTIKDQDSKSIPNLDKVVNITLSKTGYNLTFRILDSKAEAYVKPGIYTLNIEAITCDFFTKQSEITVVENMSIDISIQRKTFQYRFNPLVVEEYSSNSCAPQSTTTKHSQRLGIYSLRFVNSETLGVYWGDISSGRANIINLVAGTYEVYQACFGLVDTITTYCKSDGNVDISIKYFWGDAEHFYTKTTLSNPMSGQATFNNPYNTYVDLGRYDFVICNNQYYSNQALRNFYFKFISSNEFFSYYLCTWNPSSINTSSCYTTSAAAGPFYSIVASNFNPSIITDKPAICSNMYAMTQFRYYSYANGDTYQVYPKFTCCSVKLAMIYYAEFKFFGGKWIKDYGNVNKEVFENEVYIGYDLSYTLTQSNPDVRLDYGFYTLKLLVGVLK